MLVAQARRSKLARADVSCVAAQGTPWQLEPRITLHTSRPYWSFLWQCASTDLSNSRRERLSLEPSLNAWPFSGASMPLSRILCWTFAPSSTVIVSPSETPTTRPSTVQEAAKGEEQ